jgi:hypothetical protein
MSLAANEQDPAVRSRWESRARRLARRINTGWWLESFMVPGVIFAAAGAVAVLLARAQHLPMRVPALILAAAGLATSLFALLRSRRRFFSLADALVRLEAVHHLENRLTCARDGLCPWPPFDDKADGGLRMNWPRTLLPPCVAAACLGAALWVPLPQAAATALPRQAPLSWSQMQTWIEQLEQQQAADPRNIQDARDRLAALQNQPPDAWFSHHSLEAGDTQRDRLAGSISKLVGNLAGARSVLRTLEAKREREGLDTAQSGEKTRELEPLDSGLSQAWQSALEGLQSGDLKAHPSLLKSLEGLDPSKLRMLSAAELKELSAELAKSCQACKSCNGGCTNGVPAYAEAEVAAACEQPGQGGVTRGRGDAPLSMQSEENKAGTSATEGVGSKDFRNAALGDRIAEQAGKHDVDPSQFAAQAGGAVRAGGAGEAVWRTEAMPEEAPVLSRFFADQPEKEKGSP